MVKPAHKIAMISLLSLLAWGAVAGACLVATRAHAQTLEALSAPDASVAPAPAPAPPVALPPSAHPPIVLPAAPEVYDPDALTAKAFDAIAVGDWWALAAVAVMLLTWAIRTGTASTWASSKAPALAKFIADPMVSFCLPIVLSAAPGVFVAVKSGSPFTLGLLAGAVVKVAGGSKLLFLGIKNFNERRELKVNEPPAPAPTAPGGGVAMLLLIVVASYLCSSCTASQAFIISGESLDAVGDRYAMTGEIMRKGLGTGKVTPAQFRKWAAFSERFELSWKMTHDAWKRARIAKDQIEEKKTGAALEGIALELFGFYQQLKEAHLLPAGAP